MKILITHGTFGSPQGNWFPWLVDKLQADGHPALVPAYPTPEGQSFEAWLEIFDREFGLTQLDPETVLVGHSLGAAFCLRLLELTKVRIKGCYLVSGFIQKLGLPEFDILNQTFIEHDFDWRKIKAGTAKLEIFHGDDDPYVLLRFAQEIADKIEVDLTVLPNGKHLNAEAGLLSFPLLYERITFS